MADTPSDRATTEQDWLKRAMGATLRCVVVILPLDMVLSQYMALMHQLAGVAEARGSGARGREGTPNSASTVASVTVFAF